jgi:hypothetical protein
MGEVTATAVSPARDMRLDLAPGAAWAVIPAGAGLRAGISLAAAGDMSLSRRHSHPFRRQLLDALGIDPARAYGVRQVHSRTVVALDGLTAEELADVDADGMVTDDPDVLLTVTVADCYPVFLADRSTGAFGLVHSGWKGTGIVTAAVRAMAARFGTRAADLHATVGPGIGACCYHVPEDRATAFARDFGAGVVVRGPEGAARLDLRGANVALLDAAGVGEVTVVTDCTCCTEALGSFRRQGPGAYTLMLAFAGRGRE